MKQLPIFLFCLLIKGLDALAQQAPIMVCNAAGTSCNLYNNLDTAYRHAPAGSYFYIPGGIFSFTDTIKKEVHWVGAGFNQDSSIATGTTNISTFSIGANADYSSFEGFQTSDILIKANDSNLRFSRVYANSIRVTTGNTLKKALISGCVVSLLGSDGQIDTSIITNNIVDAMLNMSRSNIYNNILFQRGIGNISCYGNGQALGSIGGVTACKIKNNIFYSIYGWISPSCPGAQPQGNSNNYFQNNANVNAGGSTSLLSNGGAVLETGTINITATNLLVNCTSNGFAFTKDFHVIPSSPGHNAGTDGTDVGIYGGAFPWKDGQIPYAPHVYYKQVSITTNANGDLPLTIRVRAEQN